MPADRPYDLWMDARLFPRGRAFLEICIVLLVLFLPYAVTFVYSLFSGMVYKPEIENLGMKVYLRILMGGVLVLLVTFLLVKRDGGGLRSLGLRKDRIWGEVSSAIQAFILIYVLQLLIMFFLSHVAPEWAKELAKKRGEMSTIFPEIPPIELFLFTLFVGIYEELIFRGFLITRLTSMVHRPWVAVILSSIFFGAVHFYQDPLAMIQIMIIAVVLGGLFVIRKNILSPILVHAAFDFTSLGMAFWGQKILSEISKGKFFSSIFFG
jgi:membrane protease YdiL (CAAX protease family)